MLISIEFLQKNNMNSPQMKPTKKQKGLFFNYVTHIKRKWSTVCSNRMVYYGRTEAIQFVSICLLIYYHTAVAFELRYTR